MTQRARQSGFSAIEALAALAIVAVALVPLAELQMQIVRSHARQRDIREEADMQRNAMALLRDINPMASPEGTLLIGENLGMHWRAAPISAAIRSTRAGEGDGDFDVRLYRVDVDVSSPHGATSFSVDQVGWRVLTSGSNAPPRAPALTNRE